MMLVITTYKRKGKCRKCGKCCEYPTRDRINAYSRAGYDVQEILETELDCPHVKRREDGSIKCGKYWRRPRRCRRFPSHPLDIAALPTCGYRFIEVNHDH